MYSSDLGETILDRTIELLIRLRPTVTLLYIDYHIKPYKANQIGENIKTL